MCAHMYVWMILKQSSLFLEDVENIGVSLYLTLFFSFAGMARGYIGHFKWGFLPAE